MRNSKKFLTLVLAVLMVMSTVAFSTSAAVFTDVKIDTKALYQATGLLSDLGVTKGTTETTFSPNDPVTREQMAAFVYRLMKAGKSVEGGANTSTFEDLVDPTFFFMVSWANNQGIIKGRSTTVFDPKGGITLQDAFTMIVRALEYEKEEALPYPFGYIDVAEKIGLDENLPSALDYTDALTRGDVAIILYNAFFADMGQGETAYKPAYEGANFGIPYTIYPTVAEKVFGVKEETQRVLATPNYSLDGRNVDNDNFDEAVLYFDGSAGYRTFSELGLSGKADDYFLSDFTLYLKEEKKGDEVETKVLYAEPLLTKKTVSKATVGKVTPSLLTDYYNTGDKAYAKASGLLTIGEAKTYLYNAPYSYAKPQITTEIAKNPASNYAVLNAKNAQFIGLAAEGKEGTFQFLTSKYNSQTAHENIFGLPAMFNLSAKEIDGGLNLGKDLDDKDVWGYKADIFANELNQMYNDGYYELDTYDSDSDGIIDYIWYKPYTFGQARTEKNEATLLRHANGADAYSAVVVDNVPTIYTFEATVEGASFKDKDFVLAYVNGPANYIKVAAIVDKTTSEIRSTNGSNFNLTLKNGTKIDTYGTSRLLVNFKGSADSETSDFTVSPAVNDAMKSINSFSELYDNKDNIGKEKEFYVYAGRLLYTSLISGTTYKFNEPVIIPQNAKTEWGSAMVGNYVVKTPVLSVYVSGADSDKVLIPVETEDMTYNNADFGFYDFSDYVGKICAYTMDSDSIYTLTKAVNADNTGALAEAAMNTTDVDAQFGIEPRDGLTFRRITGTTYQFEDAAVAGADKNANILPNSGRFVTLQDYTKIVIKSKTAKGADVFTEFNLNKLPKFDNTLENIQIILANNPTSTRTEYLAVLYAETNSVLNDVSTTTDVKENIRIVKTNGTIDIDNDGVYHYYYELYNPYTGKVEAGVPGLIGSTNVSLLATPAAIGSLYEVSEGVLQDKNALSTGFYSTGGNIDRAASATPAPLVEITGYSNNVLELEGAGLNPADIYKTDSETKVVMITAGGSGLNDFKWGSISEKTLADLSSGLTGTGMKNYCTISDLVTGKITTKYADNMEAYVIVNNNKSVTGQYKVLDYVIIVREKVKDEAHLNQN